MGGCWPTPGNGSPSVWVALEIFTTPSLPVLIVNWGSGEKVGMVVSPSGYAAVTEIMAGVSGGKPCCMAIRRRTSSSLGSTTGDGDAVGFV